MSLPPTTYRRYTDMERTAAVALVETNQGNVSETARQLGIPVQTLQGWVKGHIHPEAAENSLGAKTALAESFEAIAARALGNVTDEKLAKAGVVDLLKVAGIAVDKALILRGQANQITRTEGNVTTRVEHFAAALVQLVGGAPEGQVPAPNAPEVIDQPTTPAPVPDGRAG